MKEIGVRPAHALDVIVIHVASILMQQPEPDGSREDARECQPERQPGKQDGGERGALPWGTVPSHIERDVFMVIRVMVNQNPVDQRPSFSR